MLLSMRLLLVQLVALAGVANAGKLTQTVDGERRNVVFSSRRLDEGYCHPECNAPTPGPTPNPTPRPTPGPVEELSTPSPVTPRPTRNPTPSPTPNPTPLPTPAPADDQCPYFNLDFADLVPGTYVHNELIASHGVKITAIRKGSSKGHTPINGVHVNSGGGAMVFDTAHPTGNDGQTLCSGSDGDDDLGSPNQGCPGGGPGVGAGGAPSSNYPNCVPQGNVLIIQESNKSCPDDTGDGGWINFEFTDPTEIDVADILDIDDDGGEPHIHLYYGDANGSPDESFTNLPATGENGFLSYPIKRSNVKKFSIEYFGSGCIAGLTYRFCPPDPTPSPTPSPNSQPAGTITYSFDNGLSGWASTGSGNGKWHATADAKCSGSKGLLAGPNTGSNPVFLSMTVPAGMNKMSFKHTIPAAVIENTDRYWVSCGSVNLIEFEDYESIRLNGLNCQEEVVDVIPGQTVKFTSKTSHSSEYWEIDEITFFSDLETDFEDGTLGVWTVSGTPNTNSEWRVEADAKCVGTKGVIAGPHTGTEVHLSRTVPAGMNRMSFKHSLPSGVLETADKLWVSCGSTRLVEYEDNSSIRTNGLDCHDEVLTVTPGQVVKFTAQTSYSNEFWEIDEIIFFSV